MNTRNPTALHPTEAELVRSAFGEVIARHRVAADFDQRPFSRVVGISNSHLRKIESGETSPTLVTVWKIAAVLEVDPGTLVAETARLVTLRQRDVR